MENSVSPDYVTEKIWDGLAAGCIPIYLGPATARDMVPDSRGIIMYDPEGLGDASTPATLDALMHEIGSDQKRYEAMLKWKHRKVSDVIWVLFFNCNRPSYRPYGNVGADVLDTASHAPPTIQSECTRYRSFKLLRWCMALQTPAPNTQWPCSTAGTVFPCRTLWVTLVPQQQAPHLHNISLFYLADYNIAVAAAAAAVHPCPCCSPRISPTPCSSTSGQCSTPRESAFYVGS